jgi:hypothetical protein
MKPNGLVVDEDVFSALNAECEKIIDTRKRLPDFVFRRSFARYFAIEYCHIFTEQFAAFLFQLSNIFGDELVNYMTLDPSPNTTDIVSVHILVWLLANPQAWRRGTYPCCRVTRMFPSF